MNKVRMRKFVNKIVITDFGKFAKERQYIGKSVNCKNIYNFKSTNGRLEKGLGIQPLRVRGEDDVKSYQYELSTYLGELGFNKVMYFKQFFKNTGDTVHRLLFHCSNSKLYMFELFSNTNELTWIYEMEFDTIPAVLGYKKGDVDSILISSTNKLVVWTTDQTPYEITGVPTITSMCEYNDTLYCTVETEPEKLWYTRSLDPSSIGEVDEFSNCIVLDAGIGGGRKVVQFNESVYVFCDYGIYRVNTYAKDEPIVRLIYSGIGQISVDTITVCGTHILFVASDGVYKFNGDTVLKVEELTELLKNSNNAYATATYFNGCYYLANVMDFGDSNLIGCEDSTSSFLKNNALIKFDLNDKTCEILRGVDIKNMLPLHAGAEEKIICTFNSLDMYRVGEITEDGEVFGRVFERTYRSNNISPENLELINIRRVTIDSGGNIQMRIITDEKRYYFKKRDDVCKTYNTVIPCKKFQIEIVSLDKDAYINSVEIEYVK